MTNLQHREYCPLCKALGAGATLRWRGPTCGAGSPEPEAICQACRDKVAGLAAEGQPNPGGLSWGALRRAAESDADLDEVIQVCRLFQWPMPALITNVAYFRRQLGRFNDSLKAWRRSDVEKQHAVIERPGRRVGSVRPAAAD